MVFFIVLHNPVIIYLVIVVQLRKRNLQVDYKIVGQVYLPEFTELFIIHIINYT